MPAPTANEQSDAGLPPIPKPPKRIRQASAFNQFCKDNKKNKDETIQEQFKRYGTQWQKLSDEQKEVYKSKPNQGGGDIDRPKLWEDHFGYVCNELDYCNKLIPTPAVILYQNPLTKCVEVFGTREGTSFMDEHPYLVTRFDCHLGKVAEKEHTEPASPDAEQLVRKLFNTLYSTAVKKPGSKMPYSKIEKNGIRIEGIDQLTDEKGSVMGLELKNPAKYGKRQQRIILQNADNLRCCITKHQAPAAAASSPPTSKMVTIQHANNPSISVEAPEGTTHVILDDKTREITGACTVRHDKKVKGKPSYVVVTMEATYTPDYTKGRLYAVPKTKLMELSPAL